MIRELRINMKILAKAMITNLQIMTEEGTICAVLEPENRISAAYQNMRTIPHVLTENYGEWVQVLDLSHNKLRDVSRLREMQNLHTLIMDHNLIVSTTVFPRLPSLRVLWLNFNLISDVTLFVPALARSCPNLKYLSLMGNIAAPFVSSGSAQESYREYVIGHFEHLRYLDDKPVAALERMKYVRMEEPSFMEDLKDTVENFFHDITSSLVVKVNKKFNSIV